MHRARWSLVGMLALAVGNLANGQGANVPNLQPVGFSSALTGIKPSDVQFRQIDTKGLLRAPVPTIGKATESRSTIKNLFRKVFGFNSKPVQGVSPLPDPATVPGWQFPDSPIKPMRPQLPGPILQ